MDCTNIWFFPFLTRPWVEAQYAPYGPAQGAHSSFLTVAGICACAKVVLDQAGQLYKTVT